MSKKTKIYVVILVALLVSAGATAGVLSASGDKEGLEPLLDQYHGELSGVVEALSAADVPVDAATVVLDKSDTSLRAYRLEIPTTNWTEYIVRFDEAMRQLCLAKGRGALSLDYVDLGVASPAYAPTGAPGVSAADTHLWTRLQAANPFPTLSAEDLDRAKATLEASIKEAADETGVSLRSVELADENGLATLRVGVVADSPGDVTNLTEFRELLWGAVRGLNQTSLSVAIGFFEVLSTEREQLVFEVNDFVVDRVNTYRIIDYPSEK